jgi:hypothetical protein
MQVRNVRGCMRMAYKLIDRQTVMSFREKLENIKNRPLAGMITLWRAISLRTSKILSHVHQ